jgi:tetratricopeptide (TPR) repeat protein
MKSALRRHEEGEARVIPVILRPCDWEESPIGKLQALPQDGKPVTTWSNQDEAFLNITKGVRASVKGLASKRIKSNASINSSASLYFLPRPPIIGLVGRASRDGNDILETLKAELSPPNYPIVALWGAGGVGKTTIAAAVARSLIDTFGGRMVWASAEVRSDFGLSELLDAVATQLDESNLRKLAVEEKQDQVGSIANLAPTLIIVDNFETVIQEEQTRCIDWLEKQRSCSVIVTTRERLDGVGNIPIEVMLPSEADQFLKRLIASTRQPGLFEELERDRLIQTSDSNPLVMQWVVAQIDLAREPKTVLDALAKGEGNAAHRVFNRSFDLPQLGADGRSVLLALSLFVSGASRVALARVAGFGNNSQRLDNAVSALASLWLIDMSDGNTRIWVRGLTRELAKSRLLNSSQSNDYFRRFLDEFLLFSRIHSKHNREHFDALEIEKDNILEAAAIASTLNDWQKIARIFIETRFPEMLDTRGYWHDYIALAETARLAAEAHPEGGFAALEVQTNIAALYSKLGNYDKAEELYRDALMKVEALGATEKAVNALHGLGNVELARGRLAEAQEFYRDCLDRSTKSNNLEFVGASLYQLGTVETHLDNLESAKELTKKALEAFKNRGDLSDEAKALHQLGLIAFREGNLGEARRLYNESLIIKTPIGEQHGIAMTMCSLAWVEESEANLLEGVRLLRDAIPILEKIKAPELVSARRDLKRLEDRLDGETEAERIRRAESG